MIYGEFKSYFQKGLKGESVSFPLIDHPLSNDLSKLGKKVDIGKSMSILFGGYPGTGKTSMVDTYFVLNLYMWWLRNKEKTNLNPYWIYRSMERASFMKVAKWTCYLMYIKYDILIDVPTLLRKPNKLYDINNMSYIDSKGKSHSYEELIYSFEPFFDELFNRLDLVSGSENPTGVRNYAMRKAFNFGKYVTCTEDKIKINWKDVGLDFNSSDSEIVQGEKKLFKDITINNNVYRFYQYNKKYIENDTNNIFVHITDHIGKVSGEKGLSSPKAILDKHSDYMSGTLRDIFYWNTIDIMQMNRGMDDAYRQVKQGVDIKVSDFKGSGNPYENSDLVLGMINPYKLEAYNYEDYKIQSMVFNGYNRFRGLKCIKNSWGVDDFKIGYFFQGETGLVRELPKASEMTNEWYQKIVENKMNHRKSLTV
jgi:hypothetical protein